MRGPCLFALLLLAVPQAGCCSLARLFCGPDRTPWVPVSFETPEHTVRTLLEALRRDDPEVLYQCLAQEYCRQKGLDSVAVTVAWQQIRQENPGLHVAGYATVPAATRLDDDHAVVRLDVEGQALEVSLVRESRWRVRYRRDDGTAGDQGEPLATFAGQLDLQPLDGVDKSKLVARPVTVPHFGLEQLPLAKLELFAFERLWKVRALVMPQP
ncbi:MAG: hypothetical protein JNN13_11220 [Planctomycetes bacterium]|nr:hypothetical protein [Planctomycetota bacterium]